LRIDFKKTGLGDAWMRFMALSTLSRIRPKERHVVYPPGVLVPLARRLFEGFFDVAESGPADIVMSHLGLRHLLPGMLRGRRYYSPFYWTLRAMRKKITLKDKVNDLGFHAAFATNRLSRPERQYLHEYQGFTEMQGLPPFRDVTLEEYLSEAQKDFDGIHARVLEMFGQRASRDRTVVFPAGSAHQIMPPQLAARTLPFAEFAFYEKDDFAKEFEQVGLNVIRFGKPPEQICELIASASAVFSTDSFPSHLAQMWKDRAILMMTEMKARMTVHPCFPSSRVVESRAECHPCLNLARIAPDHRCQAGRVYCATWENPEYLTQLSTHISP
jgi:hypothetical protein